MRVEPQRDGSLHVWDVSPDIVYDLGNPRLYARVDGAGRVRALRVSEGAALVRDWQHTPRLDNAELSFDSAEALGRTLTLRATRPDAHVTLTTFVDASSPALFQHWHLFNPTSVARTFTLDVHLTLSASETLPEYFTALGITLPRPAPVHLGATLPPSHAHINADAMQHTYQVELAPHASFEFCLVVSVGDEASHRALLDSWRARLDDVRAYNTWLSTRLQTSDALLQSLFVAGLNAALSAYKELPSGVAGFFAGPAYAAPPRFYFRDAYWTVQAVLPFYPEYVRQQLLTLSRGIRADGACPSGVFDPALFSAPNSDRLAWLPDHFDSPSYFVLMLADYLRWTNDRAILDASVEGLPTLWTQACACLDYLHTRDNDGDGLFEKPRVPNDWADNVYRAGWVTYDLALYYRALHCAAEIASARDETSRAQAYRQRAERVRRGMNEKLWDDARGYYVDYRYNDFTETHLTADSLLAVLYNIADETRARRVLDAAQRLLQSRHNHIQPFGDWGVLCAFPPYQRAEDLFSLSAEPYRYHNGADWLYWDAVYAHILLQRGDADWRYVLTRGWEYGLAHGWLTPVEYFSPPYPPGGFLQAWSSLPAAVLFWHDHSA